MKPLFRSPAQPWSTGLDHLHRLLDSTPGAVLGGLFYGSWAVWANQSAGWAPALHIGMTHAAMSTFLTLFGVHAMNRLFRLGARPQHGAVLACGGSLLLSYALLIAVHLSLGTPRILLTLAPGLLPTVAFCLGYSLLLLRRAQQLRVACDPAIEETADEIPPLVR